LNQAPPADADAPIIAALTALVSQEHRRGFWKRRNRLRDLGYRWNQKRICRVYRALTLHLMRLTGKLPRRPPPKFRG
jgi:putative transposase